MYNTGKGSVKFVKILCKSNELWPYNGKACKCQKVNFSGEQK